MKDEDRRWEEDLRLEILSATAGKKHMWERKKKWMKERKREREKERKISR